MHYDIVSLLRSPETGNPLELEVLSSEGEEIIAGRLIDKEALQWFRIENGIADLSPLKIRRQDKHDAFCSQFNLSPEAVGVQKGEIAASFAEQIRFFRDYHVQYEADVVDSPFYRILDKVTLGRWLERALPKKSLVIEIGSGSGRQTHPIVKHGSRVVGLDLSEEMLTHARKKIMACGGAADFIVASAEQLPIANHIADATVIFGSLHHFSDPEAAIREGARVLKPQGQFYMLEPNNSVLRPLFELSMKLWALWQEEAADEPLFSEKEWTTWLHANGIMPSIRYSTYLPPHLFYLTGQKTGQIILEASDALLNSIPGVRKVGGVIIAEGVKKG